MRTLMLAVILAVLIVPITRALLERHERERREVFRLLKATLTRASRQPDRGEFNDPESVLKKIETHKRKRAGRA